MKDEAQSDASNDDEQKPESIWQGLSLHLCAWPLVLLLGYVLLRGRYDFSPEARAFSRRSYLSSAFYLTLTLPTVFYLLRACPLRRNLRFGIFGAVFVVFTLPWRWLHLHRVESYAPAPWGVPQPEPVLTFFPRALLDPGFPHDKLFFLGLLLAFSVAAIAIWHRGLLAPSATIKEAARAVLPGIVGYAAICVQSFMHTSMRSGYSLNAYFVYTPERKNWYVTHLFPPGGGRGSVSSDLPVWWGLDEYFQGVPKLPPTMLMRRSFVHYVGSQLGYFVTPYFVYIALNTLLWFAAAAACYRFTIFATKRRDVALFVGALVCIGNGFTYFVGQPFAYVGGYTCVAVVPFVFARFLAKNDEFARWRVVPIALGLALCALTYDVFPSFLALIGLTLLYRTGRLRALSSVILATAIYGAFIYLQFFVFNLVEDKDNTTMIREAARNLKELLREHPRGLVYQLTVTFLSKFTQSLGYAFEFIAVLLAIAGLWLSQEKQRLGRTFLVLFSPAIFAGAYFHFGRTSWQTFPMIELARILYVAFPAMYLAAAFALVRLEAWLKTTRLQEHSQTVTWCAVFLLALWQNADAFGFISPTFHFYFANHGTWLDHR